MNKILQSTAKKKLFLEYSSDSAGVKNTVFESYNVWKKLDYIFVRYTGI